MWARAVEFMLGLWLVLSPYIFGYPSRAWGLWASSWVCALAIMVLSGLSFWGRARRAHLWELVVVVWLVLYGYFAGGYPASPGYQNHIFVGLILLLFAIIPSEANQPPRSWREHYAQRARARGR